MNLGRDDCPTLEFKCSFGIKFYAVFLYVCMCMCVVCGMCLYTCGVLIYVFMGYACLYGMCEKHMYVCSVHAHVCGMFVCTCVVC